jgi:mannose-6-phosphate isomerase-like protein (cupin superfamily)
MTLISETGGVMATDGKGKASKGTKAQEARAAGAVPRAKVMRMEEASWEVPPGHSPGALSKMLVHPSNADTRYLDFRISSYEPRHYAEVHVHEVAENLYYVLRGKGIVELDGVRHLVEPHTVVHIPAGVRHGIFNTGLENLVFLVVATPPGDMPAVKQTGGREP